MIKAGVTLRLCGSLPLEFSTLLRELRKALPQDLVVLWTNIYFIRKWFPKTGSQTIDNLFMI